MILLSSDYIYGSIMDSFFLYIGSKIYIEKIFSKKYPNNIFDWLQGENRNLHKISWEKNLTESVANIWDCTGEFRKVIYTLNYPFCKFELWFFKLNLWFCNLEVIPQLGDDFTTWRWFTTWFVAWRWFCNMVRRCEDGGMGCEMALVCQRWVSQLIL